MIHPIPPICDSDCRILILGSFPSVKSREGMFFYHHPQNRFWQVMAAVLEAPVPETIAEKTDLLLRNHIALWDVIASCEITGSSDSSIRSVIPNDLAPLLAAAPIKAVFCNGGTAFRLYNRYARQQTGLEAALLPSTSPANAAWSLPRLIEAWQLLRTPLGIYKNFTKH